MKVLIVAEGKHEHTGALETLVRRLNAAVLNCKHDRLARNDIHAHHGTGRGFYKKAIRWMQEAERESFDAIVLLVDEDGQRERRTEIDDAQAEHRFSTMKRAMGVAIHTFDAWMLADEVALTRALGYPVQRQPDPESIAVPKDVCRRLLEFSPSQTGQARMYASVAEASSLQTLAERCSAGFAPFAARVRQL